MSEADTPPAHLSAATEAGLDEVATGRNMLRWVGTAPVHESAVWAGHRWIETATEDGDEALDATTDSDASLSPEALAHELANLRRDLTVLAHTLTHHSSIRRAEMATSGIASFFASLQSISSTQSPDSASNNPVTDPHALPAAQKALPKYVVAIRNAEILLKAMDNGNLHHEETVSLLHAQMELRDIKKQLEDKEKEITELKAQLAARPVAGLELPRQRRASEWLDRPSSSYSVSNILVRMGRPLTGLLTPPGSPQTSANSPQAPESPKKDALSLVVTPRKSLPSDPLAFVSACGGWFQEKETYDFFISYRVASEARVAMELYFRLKDQRILDEMGNSRQVRVYWDKECLKKGQDWRNGFVQGLKNSRCVLMLVSAGVTENMVWSGENTDNVLLEWETAVMAGQKGICVPQPVFINEVSKTDAMHTVKGLDAVSAFIKSDKCPKVRPNLEDSHKWSADQTLREVKQLQGVNLDVNEVSWVIPDLIKALQTFLPLKMKNAALQCATEASFFKYFHPQINFDDTAYDISFLTSNDLKEVFGYKEEDKKSILEYREKLESLVLTFQTTPRVSTRSMRVLSEGLKKNYSFLQDLTLKGANPVNKSDWSLLVDALKINDQINYLDLRDNDLSGLHDLHDTIRVRSNITGCSVGSDFGFNALIFLRGLDGEASINFVNPDSATLALITELWEYAKPTFEEITFEYENPKIKESEVPANLGMWLAKVDGLKSLSIGSDALISALTTCITSSKTIYEIGIQFTDTAAPVKKRDNERTTQNKRKDGNRIGKKPAQAWMTPLCEALVQRGKQLMELRDVSASVHDADTTEVAATTLVDEAEDAAETSGFHSLVLRLNNLSLGDEDMTVLAEAISQMKTGIEELTLFENSITAAGASTLLKAFSPGSLISTLNLEGNEIGPGCGKELHSFLSLPTQLKTFIIARNPIGDYGVKQLCEGLSKNTVPLIEDLDVRRTNMGSNGIKALSNMLAENATIKYLDISENDLKSDAFEAMGETLKKNSTLLQLNMQNLDCGPDGIDHLVDGLKSKSCPLEHLYFDSNNLGNSASAKILSCATSNFTIGIAENSITGEEPFLQIMQQKILSSEVTEVYLLDHNLTDPFVAMLGQAVSKVGEAGYAKWKMAVDKEFENVSTSNKSESGQEPPSDMTPVKSNIVKEYESFSNLDLSGCNLGSLKADQVVKCIPGWNMLHLDLSECNLDDTFIPTLIERLMINPIILGGEIKISGNKFSESGLSLLTEAVNKVNQIRVANEEGYEYNIGKLTILCMGVEVSPEWFEEHQRFLFLETTDLFLAAPEMKSIDI